jgi:hypothetical protein
MPMMVQAKSGVRPKSPTGDKPAKKPAPKRAPKSVREVDDRLRRLGPYPLAEGPYDDLDYDALTRRRLDWTAQRRYLLALRHELGKKTDNDAIQAKATVEVAVDDPESKRKARKNLTRVKQSEAWRYRQLTPMQRQAEGEMILTWRTMTVGLGTASAKYGSFAPGHGGGEHELSVALKAAWANWLKLAKSSHISFSVVLDCLVEPKTLTDIEKERRLDAGQALAIYQQGLDLWCTLRGWVRQRAQHLDNLTDTRS